MYYSMWNEKFENIRKDFYRNNGEIKNINRFSFNIDGRRNVESFRIEQLDFLTSLYKNEKDFIDELCKYQGYYIDDPQNNKPITIATLNKKNLKIKNVPVIYNDKFINEITSEIRSKKLNRNKEKGKVILDNTEHLIDFVEYVKTLALNEISRKYLVNPRTSLVDEIPIEDRYILKDFISGDKKLKNGMIKRGLRSILTEYVGYKSFYDKMVNNGYLTLELDANLKTINNDLLMHFRSSYLNIREVIVWEDNLKRILEKQMQDKSCQNRDEIENCLNYINFQRSYRNDIIDKNEFEYYQYEFLYDKIEPLILNRKREPIKNEKMLQLFNEGGIAAVWEGMDADEVYRNESDAVRLGIIRTR